MDKHELIGQLCSQCIHRIIHLCCLICLTNNTVGRWSLICIPHLRLLLFNNRLYRINDSNFSSWSISHSGNDYLDSIRIGERSSTQQQHWRTLFMSLVWDEVKRHYDVTLDWMDATLSFDLQQMNDRGTMLHGRYFHSTTGVSLSLLNPKLSTTTDWWWQPRQEMRYFTGREWNNTETIRRTEHVPNLP